MPQPRPQRYLIDPVAFAVAIIAGPVLVTLFTFWLVFVPVFALVMGGPIYLIIGVPVLMWDLSRNPASAERISLMALLAIAILCVGTWAYGALINDDSLMSISIFYGIFGGIFAPIWGYVTGKVYLRMRRDLYVNPMAL
ncbi:MAG: hypothetical protein AB8B51_19815 [Sedimentitalea sp.]